MKFLNSVRNIYRLGIFVFSIALLLSSCKTKSLHAHLSKEHWFTQIEHSPKFEFQAQVIQLKDGQLHNAYQHSDLKMYFYPASTVKLLTCLAALEKINQLDEVGIYTNYVVEDDTSKHSIAQDIELIFAVSDNAANNRLYEFVGRDAINQMMEKHGLTSTRIAHRLSSPRSADSLCLSLQFLNQKNEVILKTEVVDGPISPSKAAFKNLKKGKGYYKRGVLIHEPMDFSQKNIYPLQDMMGVFQRIFAPEIFTSEQQFDVANQDLIFLKQAMKKYPYELGMERNRFYDGYVKFLYLGTDSLAPNNTPTIYSKSGEAYGYISDGAFVEDVEHNLKYFICAELLVNEDEIFNDDQYEYNQIGIPFLAQFGKSVHSYFLNQKASKN